MSHSIDSVYAAYVEERVLAAETHPCDACDEKIVYGAPYTIVVIVEEDYEVNKAIRRCERCQKIHEHLRKLGADHEMWPDELLNCGEEYKEHWGKEPPPEIAALAFARPGDKL